MNDEVPAAWDLEDILDTVVDVLLREEVTKLGVSSHQMEKWLRVPLLLAPLYLDTGQEAKGHYYNQMRSTMDSPDASKEARAIACFKYAATDDNVLLLGSKDARYKAVTLAVLCLHH